MSLLALNLGVGISSMTLAQMVAAAPPDGTIIYNSTYKQHFRYVTDRWWPFGGIDPRYGYLIEDEMTGPSQIGWHVLGTAPAANLGTYQGMYYVETAAAASRAYLMSYVAGTAFGLMDVYAEAMLQIPTLATVGEDFCAMFGFNDVIAYDANGACVDGAYFTLNRAVNTTKWITNTTSNSTNTATNTSTTVAAGTSYRLGILVSQTNSNVVFSVNGTAVATHTTNIPSGAARSTGCGFKLDKTAGTLDRDIYAEYFAQYGFFSSLRVP